MGTVSEENVSCQGTVTGRRAHVLAPGAGGGAALGRACHTPRTGLARLSAGCWARRPFGSQEAGSSPGNVGYRGHL